MRFLTGKLRAFASVTLTCRLRQPLSFLDNSLRKEIANFLLSYFAIFASLAVCLHTHASLHYPSTSRKLDTERLGSRSRCKRGRCFQFQCFSKRTVNCKTSVTVIIPNIHKGSYFHRNAFIEGPLYLTSNILNELEWHL
jgi:hypothetical protein